MSRAVKLAVVCAAVAVTGCAAPERAAPGGQGATFGLREREVELDDQNQATAEGAESGSAAVQPATVRRAAPPPRSEGGQGQDGLHRAWDEPAHGPAGQADPTASGGCRFETPGRVDPQVPSSPLPARPRLGLVVVRGAGVVVHEPSVLLDLEGRLDGAVAAVVALPVGGRPTVGLAELARLGRARGLDLVLVDVKLAGERRDGWLLAAATGEVVGTFACVADDGEATVGPPPQVLELAARIERAWLALP